MNTTKRKHRPMSNASRLWVAAGNLWPPFCNQMVVEGAGSIELDEMKKAVARASEANPGARLVFRGVLGCSRWVDSGACPGVREVDGSGWSGYGPEGASFVYDRLDPSTGPTCEVLLVRGDQQRCIFRTHHAVMDGRGTLSWAEDIFNALRGDALRGSDHLAIEDDFLNVSPKNESPILTRYVGPFEKTGDEKGFIWKRIRVDEKTSLVTSRIMCLVAQQARARREGPVRVGVPVDLRYRREGFRSTSNLTNAIFFDIGPYATPESLAEEIKSRLEKRSDGALTWEDRIVRHLPLSVLQKALVSECDRAGSGAGFRFSAIVSNMGRMPLEALTTPRFRAERVFFIPPGNEWAPFFVVLTGTPDSVEIVLSAPGSYATGDQLGEVLENIRAGLKG